MTGSTVISIATGERGPTSVSEAFTTGRARELVLPFIEVFARMLPWRTDFDPALDPARAVLETAWVVMEDADLLSALLPLRLDLEDFL